MICIKSKKESFFVESNVGGAPVVQRIKIILETGTVSVVGNRFQTFGIINKQKQFDRFDGSGKIVYENQKQ